MKFEIDVVSASGKKSKLVFEDFASSHPVFQSKFQVSLVDESGKATLGNVKKDDIKRLGKTC